MTELTQLLKAFEAVHAGYLQDQRAWRDMYQRWEQEYVRLQRDNLAMHDRIRQLEQRLDALESSQALWLSGARFPLT